MGEKNEVKVRLSTVVYLFIIVVLVVALGVVYYLGFVKNDNANNMIANGDVTEKNNIALNEQVTEENIKYTYEKMKGLYTYTTEENSYSLYLWENGTFQYGYFYDFDEYVGDRIIGNYIIEDNVIKLNYMFRVGTDISLDVTTGNKELKIDAYDSITLGNSDFNNKISLKKDNDQEINEMYKNNSFFNIINNYHIHNKVNGR